MIAFKMYHDHRVQAILQLQLQVFNAGILRDFISFKHPFIFCGICYFKFQNSFNRDCESVYMCDGKNIYACQNSYTVNILRFADLNFPIF